jgi:hypothetical protein
VYALSKASGVTAGEGEPGAAEKVESAPALGSALLTGLSAAP